MFGNISTMFTGKPHVAELGYTFLFRNYNSSLGKWSTSDPLGYPDGWNNFAYCNNGVTASIDQFGTDIYHLVDPNGAVFGAGHSAWIVGNDQDGYTTYDYSPVGSASSSGSSASSNNSSSGSSSGGSSSGSSSGSSGSSNGDGNVTGSPESKTYSRLQDAIDYMNSLRTENNKYTHIQQLITTPTDDAIAQIAAAAYMLEGYGLFKHNCYQLGIKMINEINNNAGETKYSISTSIVPNTAFDENLLKKWKAIKE